MRIVLLALLAFFTISLAIVAAPTPAISPTNVLPVAKITNATNTTNKTTTSPAVPVPAATTVVKLPPANTAVPANTAKNATNASPAAVIAPHMAANISPSNLPPQGGACTNSSRIGRPEYATYAGHYVHIGEPAYISAAGDDCSMLAVAANATADMAGHLASLREMEESMNSSLAQAGSLLASGNASLACLPVFEPDQMLAGSIDVAADASDVDLSASYHLTSIGTQAKTAVRNFYVALECAYSRRNYSDAHFRALEGLSGSLGLLCSGRWCMTEDRKRHYFGVLEEEHDDALYYADGARRCAGDARDFADEFNRTMARLSRAECLDMAVPEVSMPAAALNAGSGNATAKVLSAAEVLKRFPPVANATLVPGPQPVYVVTAKETKKLLGLLSVEVETVSRVDASSGSVLAEERPWWAFLLFE